MDKLYYNINEVSAMLDTPASTLRFWEKEFKELKPARGGKGSRQYTANDIALLRRIVHYTKDCGFTLEGTREQLRGNQGDGQKERVISDLKEVRKFLVSLKETL
ncbi:MAG: MerR family transcriptional regulator [Bacteroidales bacterium]|nr:MerR family transcriptional regulator [Bacteroidales bacterium]